MDMGYMSWICLNGDPDRVRRTVERNERQSFVVYQAVRRVTRWFADLPRLLASRRRPAFAGRAVARAVGPKDPSGPVVCGSHCSA